MNRSGGSELETPLRREPTQSRAVKRRDAIIAAAAALIADGHRATTTKIADLAGIPVGSIYQYFADLDGIYLELFSRLSAGLRDEMANHLAEPADPSEWRVFASQSLRISRDYIHSNPAYAKLRFETRTPATEAIEQEATLLLSDILVERWKNEARSFEKTDARIVASMAARLFSLAEQAYYDARYGKPLGNTSSEEAERALISYLALYLDH